MSSLPLQFLLMTVAGWMTRNQNAVTEYLLAENAVLREQLRGRRIRYTDAQRRKLASAAKKLGRKGLKGRAEPCEHQHQHKTRAARAGHVRGMHDGRVAQW